MKALYYAKPVEYRLETAAETLVQGDTIAGSFAAVNRGSEALNGQPLSVALAYAVFKEIKENPARAFEIIDTATLAESVALKPESEFTATWRFDLAPECPVTTKTGSLFLLYGGRFDEPGSFGMLDLRVDLSPVLAALIATIENHFSFKAGPPKTIGGYTEVPFTPPASYARLERINVLMRIASGVMELQYKAKVKVFDRGAAKGVKSKAIDVQRAYPLHKVLIGGKHPNRPFFKSEVESALMEIVPSLFEPEP